MDPIAVIRVGDCHRGGDYRQPDAVLSPKHGFRSHPGDESVTRVEHELQQWPEGLLHVGESRQAATGIRPVTVVLASPELTERHASGMPPVTVPPQQGAQSPHLSDQAGHVLPRRSDEIEIGIQLRVRTDLDLFSVDEPTEIHLIVVHGSGRSDPAGGSVATLPERQLFAPPWIPTLRGGGQAGFVFLGMGGPFTGYRVEFTDDADNRWSLTTGLSLHFLGPAPPSAVDTALKAARLRNDREQKDDSAS
ncbi:hypothetical protein ACWC5I_06470 [Kitasatospora sp. NPDC001574]